jgi:hypothetical protein
MTLSPATIPLERLLLSGTETILPKHKKIARAAYRGDL